MRPTPAPPDDPGDTPGDGPAAEAGALPHPAPSPATPKRTGVGPRTWLPVVWVDADVVARLSTSPFRIGPGANGDTEVWTPGQRGFVLLRASRPVDGRRLLAVLAPRPPPRSGKPRRSEHAIEEGAYAYIAAGLARLPQLDLDVQAKELLRLLRNAFRHVAGYDVGGARPQLEEMRGPPVRGGLPSLGKRRP